MNKKRTQVRCAHNGNNKSQGQVIYFHATEDTEKSKKICVICVICGFYFKKSQVIEMKMMGGGEAPNDLELRRIINC